MDWNQVQGNWKQLRGKAKEKWGKLIDDDLNVIEGRREQLEGKLQQRYGFAKAQIHKDVDYWFRTLKWALPHPALNFSARSVDKKVPAPAGAFFFIAAMSLAGVCLNPTLDSGHERGG